MSRGLFAGMTDYSHQSLDDMFTDLGNWISSISEVEHLFSSKITVLAENHYWEAVPYDIKGLFGYALRFFETARNELQDISIGIRQEVHKHHITRIESLARTASGLNERFGRVWHSDRLGIADYSDVNFLTLEQLYREGRDMVADMIDLGNLAARLEDFAGRKSITSVGPIQLYIDDIDSFDKVKNVSPDMIEDKIKQGYVDLAEEDIQIAIERILREPLHKKDWGGESNDLYTNKIRFKGERMSAAFLLKGNGLKKKTLEIKDCGSNGDQILRLLQSPALIFIVQFVGNISEAVIKDIEGKVRELRADGRMAWCCIIDGQDTARLLRAYGEL